MNIQKIARLIIIWSLLLPAAASAQVTGANIAGVVRDPSGAVLPGVTIEAASPALIEKVRTVVSDGQGLYQFVELRPGVYTVTFTLPGFSSLKREGLELAAGFAATVNAELKVGTLEETVTVSGQAPVVDTQSVRGTTTLARTTLDALPGTGRLSNMVNIVPGATASATLQSVGGVSDRTQTAWSMHGAPGAAPVMDGINQAVAAGGAATFIFNNLTFQEIVLETSGMSAERSTGGVQMNIIPKDGGNTFSGTFTTSNAWPGMQAGNLTDALIARGLTPTSVGAGSGAPSLKKLYDTGGALGGPIKRDSLWFFFAHRSSDYQQYQQGNYFNQLTSFPGLPAGVTFYQPDLSRPAVTDDWSYDTSLRLTWQATAKHKLVVADSVQPNCNCSYQLINPGATLNTPDATGQHHYNPNGLGSVSWTYPATNRLLFEAGGSTNIFTNNTKRQPGVGTDVIAITDTGLNLRYGSRATDVSHSGGYRVQYNRQWHQRFAVSYVTGAHAFKTGLDLDQLVEGRFERADDLNQINGARSYTFRNQVPQSVTIWAVPYEARRKATGITAYVQDQWTIHRMTLNLGVRGSNSNNWFPPQHLPAGYFVPERSFPQVNDSLNWTNVNLRLGAAYDVFGTGRTAIKVALGRFTPQPTSGTSANGTFANNPLSAQATSANRTWNDANRNYVPDCTLDASVPGANGECGPISDTSFGQVRAGNTRYATDALSGFNREFFNWQGSVQLQQELRTGMALNVGYFRTWYGGFLVTDNRAVPEASFTPYCVTAPVDSRLPGGGGNQVCGLYDVTPAFFGKVDNLVTQASNYGGQTQVFNGVDILLTERFGKGGQLSGGVSTGRQVTDNCFANNFPSVLANGALVTTPRAEEFCHVSPSWSAGTQVKFLVVYPLPWDFQSSATYQNVPGIPILASYVATNAQILPSLGRNLGSCGASATCNGTAIIDLLPVPSNVLYEPRLQQLDLRFSRLFRLGGKVRLRGNFDVYNVFNVSSVLNENNRYSNQNNQWQNVLQILGGRLVKLGVQLDF